MQMTVVLEQLTGNGYRATAFAPTPLVAEASTREQAVDRIRAMIRERLTRIELIQVEVPGPDLPTNPWLAMAGTWRGHPDAIAVEQAIKDHRQEVE